MSDLTITQRPAKGGLQGLFDLEQLGRRVGYLSYALEGDDTMIVDYVEVDRSLRGRGMGNRLVGAAVDWARANQRKIEPH